MAQFSGAGPVETQLMCVKQLLDSLLEGRAIIGAVGFERSVNDGVGVFAKEALSKGSLLVQIPFDQCISVERITKSVGLRLLFSDQTHLVPFEDEVLAIGLMFGRLCLDQVASISDLDEQAVAEARLSSEEQCPWLLHIKTLPLSFNTTLFWQDDELLELKGCTTFHLTQLMKRQIDKDWEGIHAQLAQAYPDVLGGATKDLYMWALSTIYSRAVGITRRGVPHRVIPPLIDMANHDPYAAAETADMFDFDDALDALKFTACCDMRAKDECCAVYGQYPNSKLAYTYGFVLHPNPHRSIDLWTRLPPSSWSADRKRLLLEENPLTAHGQTYDFRGTLRSSSSSSGGEGGAGGGNVGFISPALLATIRVIQISNVDELSRASNAFAGVMISVRNEAATYASLRALLQSRMNVETAESDKKRLGEMLLDGATLGDRQVMALVIRVEERELIQECLCRIVQWSLDLEDKGEVYIPPDSYQ